ncbi:MAG: YggS family pyridoxal phosphate-dependent enzyme [Janthinobacterium lividum]
MDDPSDLAAAAPRVPDDGCAVARALATVRGAISRAALAAGRGAEDVTLVAVSKTHPAERVALAIAAGQRRFGENRVQEAQGKFPALREAEPGLHLHLIGGLQTNKAREAVRLFDVIEVLDRPRLADAVADAVQREGRQPRLLVQVNVGDEAQKSGVSRAEADAFVESCRARFGDALAGLMCVPPAGEDPAPHFAWLAGRAAAHGLGVLSMGMSGDYAAAVACGATHVRVGSAIFGSR